MPTEPDPDTPVRCTDPEAPHVPPGPVAGGAAPHRGVALPSRRRRTLLAGALAGLAMPAAAQDVRADEAPAPPAPATAPGQTYAGRPEAMRFAEEVAARRGLPLDWLQAQLAQARRNAAVERLIMPPPAGTAKNWAAYRDRFVERERIAAGAAFWRRHADWLQRAEARWGVPPSVVVGIVGVETFYGRITGNFRVVDALATLSFDFPRGRRDRTPFFTSELEEFFVWCHREGNDPQAVKGSFAGAMGLPQFMPGSVNRWAVDFDEDGHIDLHGSAADTVGSIAHYLAAFGWQRDLPTHWPVRLPVDVSDRAVLLAPDILPSFTPAQFVERGAGLPPEALAHDGLLALVELQNGDRAPTHVAGTSNFYAITRYNWSSYYAMAVIALGDAVEQAVEGAVKDAARTAPPSSPRPAARR